MNKNNTPLQFNAKLGSFEKINDRFLRAKCYVLALGKNRNKSYFSEENVNKAYPSLAYRPVIGHLMEDENGNYYLGGHDYKVDMTSGFKLVSQCVPFGVTVINDEAPIYEDVVEENGEISKYLTCEVILWIGRYPKLEQAMYSSDIYFNHSMEIIYSKSKPLKEDNSYTDITEFSFDALCMLNKSDDPKFNVQPCFPSASIKPFSYEESKQDLTSLVEEMRIELKACFAKNSEEQGGKTMDKKAKILLKYGKTVEELDFSIEELSEDELSQKMNELFGKKPDEPEISKSFSATYRQKLDILSKAVRSLSEYKEDANGNFIEETYLYLSDFNDEYVFVEKSIWKKGEDYSCKVGRIAYTEADEEVTLGEFEEMVVEWLTLSEKAELEEQRANFEKINSEFETYKKTHSNTNEEFESLTKYKANKEKEVRDNAETSIFNEFESSIGEFEEFSNLKKSASDYTLEALKKECIYIRGLYAATPGNTDKDRTSGAKPLNFTVENTQSKTAPYGGVVEKYLSK